MTAKDIKEQYKKFIGRKIFFVFFFAALIIIISGVSTTLGSYPITVKEVYSIIWRGSVTILQNLDFIIVHGVREFTREYFTTEEIVVWQLRLPRIFLGIIAGIGLGLAGAVMQAILRNPLASPYTLGISSGAGFGASLAILAGAGIVGGKYLIIGNAFVFALLVSFIILALSSRKGATPETMILAGIAMMYLFGAMTTILQYFGEAEAVKEAVFWMVGDLNRASWPVVTIILGVLACCAPLLMLKSWDLNVMGAGDETAKSLGVNVKRIRVITMVVSTLLVATIVCFTGTIGFIGLVAPHMTRLAIGGDNKYVLPVSGLLGAVILISADLVARRIIAPVILPVGAVTAFMGAPLFLYLIMRRRREYW
ncbi:MAG: iron ABC transporter permease [Methanosarcinales archaeon]|nr:iron ABC transporter permease [Methanosarcinales archaeon]